MKFKKDLIYITLIASLVAGLTYCYRINIHLPSEQYGITVYYNKQVAANELLIQTINQAEQYVYFAIYTFTRTDIKDALLGAKYRGLNVRGIVDKQQITRIPEQGKIVAELQRYGIPIYVQDHQAIMHLKTLVTDKAYFSGSYNWTVSATDSNDEVIEIGRDPTIKKQYEQVLNELFTRYAPTR